MPPNLEGGGLKDNNGKYEVNIGESDVDVRGGSIRLRAAALLSSPGVSLIQCII